MTELLKIFLIWSLVFLVLAYAMVLWMLKKEMGKILSLFSQHLHELTSRLDRPDPPVWNSLRRKRIKKAGRTMGPEQKAKLKAAAMRRWAKKREAEKGNPASDAGEPTK